MNLLVFTTLYPNAEQPHHGLFVEKRLLELIRRYPCEVRVVAPVPWFPRWLGGRRYAAFARVPRHEIRAGIEIVHPRYLVVPKLTWRFAPLMLALGAASAVRRLRRQGFAFDVIDAHFVFPDGVAAQILGAMHGVPVCITARGSDINDSPRYWLPRRMIQWALGRAKSLIAVSGELASRMRELANPSLVVHVLPNGVDRSRFRPQPEPALRERLGIDGPMVLSVGNLRELKGHDILIRAVADLADVSLVIIGTGDEEANLKRLIHKLQLTERVHLLGAVDNAGLPAYYNAADAFALASSSEGCPNVVLEAIACGTPVVATAVGAIPDLVPASTRHLLVRERTPEAFTDALRSCLDEPPPAAELNAKAETFGWDTTCERLRAILFDSARQIREVETS